MENILDVVAERNRAVHLLETGKTGEPGRRWAYNELGIGYWRKCQEYHVPLYMNKKFRKSTQLSGVWQQKYLRLMREKRLALRDRQLRKTKKMYETYTKMFPDADIEPDLTPFLNTIAKTMRGPADKNDA